MQLAFSTNAYLNYSFPEAVSRLAGIGWSLLAGLVVYRWTAELYGRRSSLLALAMWCFGPNILAHAPLATPDMPATAAAVARRRRAPRPAAASFPGATTAWSACSRAVQSATWTVPSRFSGGSSSPRSCPNVTAPSPVRRC